MDLKSLLRVPKLIIDFADKYSKSEIRLNYITGALMDFPNFLYLGLLFGCMAVAMAWVVNKFQNWTSTEPLMDLDESRLCTNHAWEECLLLSPNETEAWKKNPEAFLKHPKTTYCGKCGFVPSQRKMVRRKLLDSLKTAQAAKRENEQAAKDVEELKELWFKNYAEYHKIEGADRAMLREGYNAYDQFVTHLPELVKEKKLARIMKELLQFKMRA